ncbi:MAG: hypothetical protein ACOCQN_01330 [Halanaerobiaceae bacterium]
MKLIKENNINVIYLNIYFQELSIYTRDGRLQDILLKHQNDINNYCLRQNLIFITIRFDDPEKNIEDTGRLINILNENNIKFIELGYTHNRLYAVLDDKYRKQFIEICEKDRE